MFRVVLAIIGTCAVIAVLPRAFPRLKAQCSEGALQAAASPGRGTPACNYGGQPYYFRETEPRTPFNVSARSWDLRAFDARCQPQPLVEKLIRPNASADNQLSVMVYGDRCWSTHPCSPAVQPDGVPSLPVDAVQQWIAACKPATDGS